MVSAGNHGAGVAYGARIAGIRATVVMPETAMRSKIAAVEAYGAEVRLADHMRLMETMEAIQRKEGQTFIHPFDNPFVIAGQGTVGLEVLEQVPDVEVVVVPVGGGGLISGIAAYMKRIRCRQSWSWESNRAAPMSCRRAWLAKHPLRLEHFHSIADGLNAPWSGPNSLSLIQELVDDVVTVDDDAICAAMSTRAGARQIAGGAGRRCGRIAGLLQGVVPRAKGRRVVAILSGGNVDLTRLEEPGRDQSHPPGVTLAPGLISPRWFADNGNRDLHVSARLPPEGAPVDYVNGKPSSALSEAVDYSRILHNGVPRDELESLLREHDRAKEAEISSLRRQVAELASRLGGRPTDSPPDSTGDVRSEVSQLRQELATAMAALRGLVSGGDGNLHEMQLASLRRQVSQLEGVLESNYQRELRVAEERETALRSEMAQMRQDLRVALETLYRMPDEGTAASASVDLKPTRGSDCRAGDFVLSAFQRTASACGRAGRIAQGGTRPHEARPSGHA